MRLVAWVAVCATWVGAGAPAPVRAERKVEARAEETADEGGRSAKHEGPLWTNAPRTGPRRVVRRAGRAGARRGGARARRNGRIGRRGDADGESGKTSIGTGFIINSDGYVVTNEHVVRGVVDLRIRLYDGRELPACVAGADAPPTSRCSRSRPRGRCRCCRSETRKRCASASR